MVDHNVLLAAAIEDTTTVRMPCAPFNCNSERACCHEGPHGQHGLVVLDPHIALDAEQRSCIEEGLGATTCCRVLDTSQVMHSMVLGPVEAQFWNRAATPASAPTFL